MVYAEAAKALGALARDPAQRTTLAAGTAIPSGAVALRCLIPPLAAAWKFEDGGGIVRAACGSGHAAAAGCATSNVPEGSPLPDIGDCSGWSEVELAETCTSVCRMMRNLCAACPEGQARVRREGILKLFIVIVHICCAYYERPSVGKDPAVVDTLLAAALQAVGNAEVGCEENKGEVWDGMWPELMVRIFESDCSLSCKEVAGMVLHNAMLGNADRLAGFAEKEACAAVLGCMLRETYAKQHAPIKEDSVAMRERLGAWTECVGGQLLSGGHLMRVHQRISTDPGLRKSKEQSMELLFWYLVEDMITLRGEEQGDTQSIRLSPSDCGYLANEFAFVLKLCSEAASSGDKGAVGLSAMLQQLLQTVAAAMTREDKECKAAVRERGLLRNVSELLRAAIAREQGQKGGSSTHGADKAMRDVAGPDTGLKRILVRVIGNMAYKDRDSQDEIRKLGAIPLVLASTQLDDKQPMAREWGLFAIRNLCEDNLENQKEIGDLKPTKVMAVPPELQKQGVSVTLDETTGKIKYSQDADSGGRVGPAHIKQMSREEERKRGVEDTQRMVEELKEMGLEANVDTDTGLIDITRPGSEPPKFSYPGGGGSGAAEDDKERDWFKQ